MIFSKHGIILKINSLFGCVQRLSNKFLKNRKRDQLTVGLFRMETLLTQNGVNQVS